MFDINDNLKKLPDCPGVYMHKDELGNIIYVGKAISLKNRVRQYFQSPKNMPPKVAKMVQNIAEFEYITTASEMEALILECNLIKKYRPRYNVLLRDDKTYPYIKVTGEEYPRIIKTRIIKKDGGKYFGPYSDAGAVNKIVDLLNSSFALKRCSATAFPEDFKPCLNYHINQCRGICSGGVSAVEYGKAVDGAKEFLNGRNRKIISVLEEKMKAAAEAMAFEEAAEYRDYIEAARALSETQRVVMHSSKDADIVISVKGEESMSAAVFFVRDGKLSGREIYEMDGYRDADEGERVSAFINQHYSRVPNLPREILVKRMPEDKEILEEYLSKLAGHNVVLIAPKKGEKKALVELATRDAMQMMLSVDQRVAAGRERDERLLTELKDIMKGISEEALMPDKLSDFRIEAYDISNTNGVDTVGAMVVFEGLKPDKKSYRKFKVRTVDGQDDYSSMREVLSRRFRRVFEGDEGFSQLPDLILMDGGKGHVKIATEVVETTGFEIPVAGMVKDDNHRTRGLIYRKKMTGSGEEYEEIPLKTRGLTFKYMGNIQEEVHRFAIEYHRSLREKSVRTSVLDEIPGVGKARRKALLEHFKGIDAIKTATKEELMEVRNIDGRTADSIYAFYHK